MRIFLFFLTLLLFSISCNNNNSDLTVQGIIPGRNVYIGGYITDVYGQSTACYWLNGERVDLGVGQIEDIVVNEGKVYAVGWTFGAGAVYWIDNQFFTLGGNDSKAYAIAVHDGDVYAAGRDNGACYWKNSRKKELTGGDSSGYGIAVKDNGNVFVGGYYMNNHHFIIPAYWKNGIKINLSKPTGGDGEVQDVKIYNGSMYYFGMSMAPNNMLGYLPKASFWKGNGNRTDLPNGGGWQKGIYGGEAYGGYIENDLVYVAGKIDWIGEVDDNGEDIPGTGGTYAHYWVDGNKVDLPGGIFNNMWVSNAYDVVASEGFVIVAGDVATETQTQVPAIWVNEQLIKLEGDKIHGIAKAIFID